jgi:hypothetical protein
MKGAIPLLPPLWLHGVYGTTLPFYLTVFISLKHHSIFLPLCIFNSSTKMAVKIQLDAPVFLTTLAFNHKMGQ